jgi:hypothetical protein
MIGEEFIFTYLLKSGKKSQRSKTYENACDNSLLIDIIQSAFNLKISSQQTTKTTIKC